MVHHPQVEPLSCRQ